MLLLYCSCGVWRSALPLGLHALFARVGNGWYNFLREQTGPGQLCFTLSESYGLFSAL